MKNQPLKLALIAITAVVLVVTGCKMFGANPAPPTKAEQKIFDITTNEVPKVVTTTNVVTKVDVVTLTNSVGVVTFSTNTFFTTNTVTATNIVEQYVYNTRPEATQTVTQLGNAVSPFTAGWGTIISAALVGLYGAWAHLRSTKSTATSSALTQEIEAIRSFILTLPQGTKIDSAVTQFMQQHQVEAGVATQVLSLIKGYSGDSTVTGIAAQLQDAINALTKPS